MDDKIIIINIAENWNRVVRYIMKSQLILAKAKTKKSEKANVEVLSCFIQISARQGLVKGV